MPPPCRRAQRRESASSEAALTRPLLRAGRRSTGNRKDRATRAARWGRGTRHRECHPIGVKVAVGVEAGERTRGGGLGGRPGLQFELQAGWPRAGNGSRKVRTPQGRTLGKPQAAKADGKWHRKETATGTLEMPG